MVSGR